MPQQAKTQSHLPTIIMKLFPPNATTTLLAWCWSIGSADLPQIVYTTLTYLYYLQLHLTSTQTLWGCLIQASAAASTIYTVDQHLKVVDAAQIAKTLGGYQNKPLTSYNVYFLTQSEQI